MRYEVFFYISLLVILVLIFFYYQKGKLLTDKEIRIGKLESLVREINLLLINHERRNKEYEIEKENLINEVNQLKTLVDLRENALKKIFESNLVAIPYLAGIMADYLTYDIEILAKQLSWGNNVQRQNKVISIREIRTNAKKRIEEAKVAIYQLEYLKTLYPTLTDVLDTDYKELTFKNEISEYDPIRDFLSREEWLMLSESEKNQKALDNYVSSHTKSKWQIGRDYELYIGYCYEKEGHKVEYFGSNMGLEDLGRDLIVKKSNKIHIVQCKYWGQGKIIHEKHIFQLYGSVISYCINNHLSLDDVDGVFFTNISLSPMANKVAAELKIKVIERFNIGEYPRIKCNLGKDEYGFIKKIYHLPMDMQYDAVKICQNGEFFAYTVAEAEAKGFRRAFKWLGNNDK